MFVRGDSLMVMSTLSFFLFSGESLISGWLRSFTRFFDVKVLRGLGRMRKVYLLKMFAASRDGCLIE